MVAAMVGQAVAGSAAKDSGRLLLHILAAVFLHGLAGDLARDHLGEHSLIATDLLKYLPAAFRSVPALAQERYIRVG
jgi:NAD(P)H-hydrate repair Nnr-like enzyme with NAD(P)H-hydrate dehydratase domain